MKNPIRTIKQLFADVRSLGNCFTELHIWVGEIQSSVIEQEQKTAARVRDDAQIEALNLVAKSTEYLAAAERHQRQSNRQRSDF